MRSADMDIILHNALEGIQGPLRAQAARLVGDHPEAVLSLALGFHDEMSRLERGTRQSNSRRRAGR
jgi:hypothetical protein